MSNTAEVHVVVAGSKIDVPSNKNNVATNPLAGVPVVANGVPGSKTAQGTTPAGTVFSNPA